MFSHDVGRNVNWTNVELLSQSNPQTSGVQRSTGTNDLVAWEAGQLLNGVGQDVNWVSGNQEDTVEARLNDWFNNRLDDLQVLVNQLQTSFTWLLWSTGSDNYQVGILAGVVVSRVDSLWSREWGSVFKVKSVTFRTLLDNVNDREFFSQALLCHRKCVA